MMKNTLILKVSPKDSLNPYDKEALTERAKRAWKINPIRLQMISEVLLVHNKVVVGVWEMGDRIIFNRATTRVEFPDLKWKESELLGKTLLDYRTSNPASIADPENLKFV